MRSINRGYLLVLIAFFIIILILFAFLFYCRCCKQSSSVPQQNDRISWNILFNKGTDKETREQVIKNIKQYVQDFYDDYNARNNTNLLPMDYVTTCPCDTLLYNYDYLSIFGAGASVTTAKSTQRTTGSGNVLISNNLAISEPVKHFTIGKGRTDRNNNSGYVIDSVDFYNKIIDTSKILAIIDSGIDSSLFSASFKNLIWKDIDPATTIYNFLPFQLQSDVFDATEGKHGSAVASIAMKTLKNNTKYPMFMILKALDQNNHGSVFSVSCALSYAIQKKATLINLSLGYEGGEDSILYHYIDLCGKDKPAIEVFAAAGNLPIPHDYDLCKPNNLGQLTSSRLFYPACFSRDFNYITSVTQMSNKDSGCFYQNYSNEYISLGVLDTSSCCAVKTDIHNNPTYYEGSSFATPVASGLRMGTILQSTPWVGGLIQSNPLNKITVGGKYIIYLSN